MTDEEKLYKEQNAEKSPINLDSYKKRPDYSGFIIVRLAARLTSTVKDEDLRKLVEEKSPKLAALLDYHKEIETRRVIRSVDPRKLLEMEKQATASDFPPLQSLTSFWRLDCRKLKISPEDLLRNLREIADVEHAYRERSAQTPAVDPSFDSYASTQNYLDASEVGIDARWAWIQDHGDGAGVGFIDLEQGWILDHEDLIEKAPTLIYNDNRNGAGDNERHHGTAVLGEVIGADNDTGIIGVAPGVSSVRVVSCYEAATDSDIHVADAIMAAVAVMAPGDVLLLEVERAGLPTETDSCDFNAIRLASGLGIIIIEAAGNGGLNLDKVSGLKRRKDDFRDSGAIMVGSCDSGPPHNRHLDPDNGGPSNFGSRLDCFAWGEDITTAGYGYLDLGTGDTTTYTNKFSGTSGASAIIAGAALIIQGMYQAIPPTGGRLSPPQMRTLLSDRTTGTRQGPFVDGRIGRMPNLRAIITDVLGITPDVYLRDDVGDTGAIPSTGAFGASPDIIVRPSLVNDPNASFGEGSGTENSNSLGSQVEAGQDNFIYVRMRNRNTQDAIDTKATVYWSEPATLVTPDSLKLIGTTPSINVPAGDTLVVAEPITWPASQIPAPGHYCFVGILDQAKDPAPLVPPVEWDQFLAFIRNHNNVALCNVNVVIDIGEPFIVQFAMTGAHDRKRNFGFEIIQRLPEKAQVVLEVPLALFAGLPRDSYLRTNINRKKNIASLTLPHMRSLPLANVVLGKGAKHRCRLIVTGLKGKESRGHSVAIRQSFEGQEVGRITWLFQQQRKSPEN